MHTTAPTRLGLIGFALISVASALIALAGCSGTVSDRSIEPIAQPDAVERLRNKPDATLFLDVRNDDEFDAGRIPGARLTRLSEVALTDDRPRFGAWDLVVVYGRDPGSARAPALVKRLLQTDHKNVALLEGGYEAWTRLGYPTEK
ncbi:MAG: rhodanese-like domain-containing protein [Planctomycetota bacterium]